jgi:hypothetical protein
MTQLTPVGPQTARKKSSDDVSFLGRLHPGSIFKRPVLFLAFFFHTAVFCDKLAIKTPNYPSKQPKCSLLHPIPDSE